jgi:hypothetical protein
MTQTLHRKASVRGSGEMKIRAEIIIELNAADFIDAAEHQRRIEELHGAVAAAYPDAVLHLRERRERKIARRIFEPRPVLHQTGRVNEYAE